MVYSDRHHQGESVPVSKIPATEEVLDYLDLKAPSIHPTVAKNFLFYGTKIIRARRPRQSNDDVEAVALGIALRTGFSTTKGSLVRSMLFPKPSGFKFYRDSFRYISVMGIIALIGFTASFVNFIRLGVSRSDVKSPCLTSSNSCSFLGTLLWLELWISSLSSSHRLFQPL